MHKVFCRQPEKGSVWLLFLSFTSAAMVASEDDGGQCFSEAHVSSRVEIIILFLVGLFVQVCLIRMFLCLVGTICVINRLSNQCGYLRKRRKEEHTLNSQVLMKCVGVVSLVRWRLQWSSRIDQSYSYLYYLYF
jgi:hypothetical protein